MIFGIIAAITAVVVAVVVGVVALVTALSESKKDADENFSNKPVGSAEEGCPLKKSISGQFKEVELKCCQTAHVLANGVKIAEGADTKFKIYRVRDSKTIDTVSTAMNGQKVRDLVWEAKRPSDNINTDIFTLDVTANGEQAKSSNEFKFTEYPDYSATKTINCSSGRFGWTGKFDIKYERNRIQITIKIKLINRLGNKGDTPLPTIGDPVSDDDKSSMKVDVEGKLGEKFKLTRNDCADKNCGCPKKVKIVVDFVESGEHHEVNLFQGSGRANASNWTRVKTRANSWAHETGHLLGWYDEYSSGAVGATPRWENSAPTHVMGSGLIVPPEYGWDFRDWFAGKTGETWEAEEP